MPTPKNSVDVDPVKKRRAHTVCRRLKKTYLDAPCALDHRNAFELLAATILSAQCTDVRVNTVTPTLFERYPDAASLAESTQEDVESIVQPTGFYREKAKNLRGMAAALVEHHGGEVPKKLDALVKLPGVGRKTANVVLGTAFGLATGVVVDTHVKRLSNRLGLTTESDPVKIERQLMALLPKTQWVMFSHRIIYHGRQVCAARSPKCVGCVMLDLCPRVGLDALAE